MTKLLRVLLFLAIISICNTYLAAGKVRFAVCNLFAQEKIIAIVNNDVITQKDFNESLNFIQIQISRQYKGKALEEKIESMKVDLLNKLIEDHLILQEAKKNNIKIDESRVKAKINEIRSRYPSDAQFQRDLARQGMVLADLESKIRDQLFMYYIIEFKVKPKVTIRPDEVTGFYKKNIKEFMSGEAREVEVITLENEDSAKSFSYNFKSGEKLEDLATRYTLTLNKLSATKGEDLRKDIEEVVFKLNIGEVSDPVKIDEKYYVFKLDNIIPSRQLVLSEVQDKINDFLFEEKMQQEMAKWLDELKKQSYIKISQH